MTKASTPNSAKPQSRRGQLPPMPAGYVPANQPTDRQAAINLEQKRLASLNHRRGLQSRLDDLETKLKARSRPRSQIDPAFSLDALHGQLAEAQQRLADHDEKHARRFGNVAPPEKDPRDAYAREQSAQIAALQTELRRLQDQLSAALNR